MKAVVMAGGEGTRLRPITSLMPKPMVPIVNQPVMEHILGLVKHHGMDEVVVTLAFMPQVIEDYFGAGEEWGMALDYSVEKTPLGTAGSVKHAQRFLDDEPFVVISGDAVTDINLTEVIAFHKERGAAVTIALKSVDDPLEFGVVITNDEGRVERFLEKPTWGQVFSDRINTGIYVIEPWVLDHVPVGESFDFSADLFPALMRDGHPIYGFQCDGYWCDVGSLESYRSVHEDILAGKTMLFLPGVHAREGLWVAESAKIDPAAELGDKVLVGENVVIEAGARVGDHVVIGDNCVIGAGSNVERSVLWDDCYVGANASISGSVLCRHVDVRNGASVGVGAVIGSESMVGRGAMVGSDVQVYPYKRIEAAAAVTSSIIWESTGARSLFVDSGVMGIVGIDVTVEQAVKLGEAYGSLLPRNGHVVVTRDTSRAARMVKRAIIAGLNSSGLNVRDLRVASPAVSRFTTQKTRCVGAVHVATSRLDSRMLEIRFFDGRGLDISPATQKKIERLYFRGEFRRAFFGEIGEILYPVRPLEYYQAALSEAVDMAGLGDAWCKVVVDMGCGAASLTLPSVASGWHMNLVALNPIVDSETEAGCGDPTADSLEMLAGSVSLFGADIGVIFDRGAERIKLMTQSGVLLDGDTALHAMVELFCRTRPDAEGNIAVPLTASQAVETIAGSYGRCVVRPGRSRRALARAVVDGQATFAGATTGGFIFGDFFPSFDAVLCVGMAARMLSVVEGGLDAVVAGLPPFSKAHTSVFCPIDRKGAVMRGITAAAAAQKPDLTEGVRVTYDDGWVLVLPDSVEPAVDVWAEAADADAARERVAQWAELVADAING